MANKYDLRFTETRYNDKKIDIDLYEISTGIVFNDFRTALKEIYKSKARPISLEENAGFRMLKRRNSNLSKVGNLTREAFIRLPNGEIYFSYSPYLAEENPKLDTLYNCIDTAFKLGESDFYVNTDELHLHPFTKRAFGKNAENYGKFLEETKIKKIRIRMFNNTASDKPLILQSWLSCLEAGSEILGVEIDNLNFPRPGLRFIQEKIREPEHSFL